MKKESLELMQKLLKPVSRQDMAKRARAQSASGMRGQLTLADAGLEDEVRKLLARRDSKQSA